MIRSTCIAPRSTDIISCSVCNDEKERFLFNPNTNLCVKCWLKGEDLPNEKVEERVDDYSYQYFSSNN